MMNCFSVCLIGADIGNMTERIPRFANYLRNLLPASDIGVTELVVRAMGNLAVASGSKAPAYVEFEVKKAFEWLQGEKAEVCCTTSIQLVCLTILVLSAIISFS